MKNRSSAARRPFGVFVCAVMLLFATVVTAEATPYTTMGAVVQPEDSWCLQQLEAYDPKYAAVYRLILETVQRDVTAGFPDLDDFDATGIRYASMSALPYTYDYEELRDMLGKALQEERPSAVRYPKGKEGAYRDGGSDAVRCLRKGKDAVIVTYGTMVNEALEAAELLKAEGVSAGVIKLGVIAPVDLRALDELTYDTGCILTAEECAAEGSVGEYIAANLRGIPVCTLNLGSGIVRQGTVAQQRSRCGIDAASIARAVRDLLR